MHLAVLMIYNVYKKINVDLKILWKTKISRRGGRGE
jgi:hypothetical protein